MLLHFIFILLESNEKNISKQSWKCNAHFSPHQNTIRCQCKYHSSRLFMANNFQDRNKFYSYMYIHIQCIEQQMICKRFIMFISVHERDIFFHYEHTNSPYIGLRKAIIRWGKRERKRKRRKKSFVVYRKLERRRSERDMCWCLKLRMEKLSYFPISVYLSD